MSNDEPAFASDDFIEFDLTAKSRAFSQTEDLHIGRHR